MDGIIEVKVNGHSISKDNACAGAQYEENSTKLRVTFSENWDGYAKKITFWNALGENPVDIQFGTNRLEDILVSQRVYIVPIPGEAMTEAGECVFVIEGYTNGVLSRTVEDKLKVLPSRKAENAGEPSDPTPTQAEQIRAEIEAITEDIAEVKSLGEEVKDGLTNLDAAVTSAEENADEAKFQADEAKTANDDAQKAALQAADGALIATKERKAIEDMSVSSETIDADSEATVTKNKVFIDDGKGGYESVRLHFGIPKGNSGVYIGADEPTDEDVSVWIDPEGEGDEDEYVTKKEMNKVIETLAVPSYAFVNILGGSQNWTAEDVTDSAGNVIGRRYGQTVNVNNAVITENSKVDLLITSEQMVVFYEKDLAFVTENDGGVVTVYCVGNIPENDYKIQAIVTEVVISG